MDVLQRDNSGDDHHPTKHKPVVKPCSQILTFIGLPKNKP